MKDGPSLDQIIPGKGYVIGNVQLLTAQVNISKSTLSCGEFVDLCEQIYFRQRKISADAVKRAGV
jgi:hypothetical protein